MYTNFGEINMAIKQGNSKKIKRSARNKAKKAYRAVLAKSMSVSDVLSTSAVSKFELPRVARTHAASFNEKNHGCFATNPAFAGGKDVTTPMPNSRMVLLDRKAFDNLVARSYAQASAIEEARAARRSSNGVYTSATLDIPMPTVIANVVEADASIRIYENRISIWDTLRIEIVNRYSRIGMAARRAYKADRRVANRSVFCLAAVLRLIRRARRVARRGVGFGVVRVATVRRIVRRVNRGARVNRAAARAVRVRRQRRNARRNVAALSRAQRNERRDRLATRRANKAARLAKGARDVKILGYRNAVQPLTSGMDRPTTPKFVAARTWHQRQEAYLARIVDRAAKRYDELRKAAFAVRRARSCGAAAAGFDQSDSNKAKGTSPILSGGLMLKQLASSAFSGIQLTTEMHIEGADDNNRLGYYFGVVSLAKDESNKLIRHNCNLPSPAHFDEKGQDFYTAFINKDPKLNYGSLVFNKDKEGNDVEQIIFSVLQAYMRRSTRAAGHFLSTTVLPDGNYWGRGQWLIGQGEQVIPMFKAMSDVDATITNTSDVTKSLLTESVRALRLAAYDHILNGAGELVLEDYNYITAHKPLLSLLELGKRSYFLVAAEIHMIAGEGIPDGATGKQYNSYAHQLNRRKLHGITNLNNRFKLAMVAGQLSGDTEVKAVKDAPWGTPPEQYSHTQQRLYAQRLCLFHISEPGDVINMNEPMVFEWESLLELYRGVYGDEFAKNADPHIIQPLNYNNPVTTTVNPALDLRPVDFDNIRDYMARKRKAAKKPAITFTRKEVKATVIKEEPVGNVAEPIVNQSLAIEPEVKPIELTTPVVEEVRHEVAEQSEWAAELEAYHRKLDTLYITKELHEVADLSYYFKKNIPSWFTYQQKLLVERARDQKGVEHVVRSPFTVAAEGILMYLFEVLKGRRAETIEDLATPMDFFGVKWEGRHFRDMVTIAHNAGMQPDYIRWVEATKEDPAALIIDGSFEFSFYPGIGVVNSRGQIFKNILQVEYDQYYVKGTGTVKEPVRLQATDSIGNFMRLFVYGYLPMLASQRATYQRNIGSNLNSFVGKANAYFPTTSDRTIEQNANNLWSEVCSYAPIGVRTYIDKKGTDKESRATVVPKPLYINREGKLGWIDAAVLQAEALMKAYRVNDTAFSDCEVDDEGLVKYLIDKSCKQYALSFSHNKGIGFKASGTYGSLKHLRTEAPSVYAAIWKAIDTVNEGRVKQEDLDDYIINFNLKVEKGLKRILLKTPTSVPSARQLHFEGKPKFQTLIKSGHGRAVDSLWRDNLPPNFYEVRSGVKLVGQTEPYFGSLMKIALMPTGIAPAGLAINIASSWDIPHGFNSKQCQITGEAPKAEEPLLFNEGTLLCGEDLEVRQETRNGLDFTAYYPKKALHVSKDGSTVLANIKTDLEVEGIPYTKPIRHERRGCDGVVEWLRYRYLSSMSKDTKELVTEWKVTWIEDQGKIRSSVLKAMQLFAKERFVANSLNRRVSNPAQHINTDEVELVYTQDASKLDVIDTALSIIGTTLVYNPDAPYAEVQEMREMMADINLKVEGRRHYEYLYLDGIAIAAKAYRELCVKFVEFFSRQLWINWEQLETGDFGASMLRNYRELVKLGKMHEVADHSFIKGTLCEPVRKDLRVLVLSDTPNPSANPTEDANVFVFWLDDKDTVVRLFQRGWSLVGREDCPIYDVVHYESSTVRESAGTSRQMGVNIRSLPRIHGDNEVVYNIQDAQANDGLIAMYRTKLLVACYEGGFTTDTNYEVIQLGKFEYDGKKTVYVQDEAAIAKVKAALEGVDLVGRRNDPGLFGDVCTRLASFVFNIVTNKREHDLVDDGFGNMMSEPRGYKSFQIWAPFLYDLNSLKSENNSEDNLSGRFLNYLVEALHGEVTRLDVAQIYGKLEALCNSDGTRKFIAGSDCVIGKGVAIPSCPTHVLLVTRDSEQFDLLRAQYRAQDIPFNPPTWADYLKLGMGAFTAGDAAVAHVTRSPLADGPVVLPVIIERTEDSLTDFFYSPSVTTKPFWRDGKVESAELIIPYSYTVNMGVVAITGMTSGDTDGDGYSVTPIAYSVDKWGQTKALVTTFEFGWWFRESAVGGEGAMTKREVYIGDHLTCKRAAAKFEIFYQDAWLKNGKGLVRIEKYLDFSFKARIMFSTFVGLAYYVYQIVEGVVEIIRAMDYGKYGGLADGRYGWCLTERAPEVVKAVSELYEIILGASDEASWQMYSNFFAPAMKGEFNSINAEQLAFLADLVDEMKANREYAPEIAEGLMMMSQCKLWEKTVKGEDVKLNSLEDYILALAMAQFEMSRGKWVGYYRELLNGTNSSDRKRHAQRQIVAKLKDVVTSPAHPKNFALACSKSHILKALQRAFTPNILGDIITTISDNPFRDEEGSAPALEVYATRLADRTGTVQPELYGDVSMPIPATIDVAPTVNTEAEYGAVTDDPVYYEDFVEDYGDMSFGEEAEYGYESSPFDDVAFPSNPMEDLCDFEDDMVITTLTKADLAKGSAPAIATVDPATTQVVDDCPFDLEPTVVPAPVQVVHPAVPVVEYGIVSEPIEQAVTRMGASELDALEAHIDALLAQQAEDERLAERRAQILAKAAQLKPEYLAQLGLGNAEQFGSDDEPSGGSPVVAKPTPKPNKPNGSTYQSDDSLQEEARATLPESVEAEINVVDGKYPKLADGTPLASWEREGNSFARLCWCKEGKTYYYDANAYHLDWDFGGGCLTKEEALNTVLYHGKVCIINQPEPTKPTGGAQAVLEPVVNPSSAEPVAQAEEPSGASFEAKAPYEMVREVSAIRKSVADLLIEDAKESFEYCLEEFNVQPGETFAELFKRERYAKDSFCGCISESRIFAVCGNAEVKATVPQWFEYLWETGFVDHIRGSYPGCDNFSAVEGFNELLVRAHAWMQDSTHRYDTDSYFWEYKRSVDLDLFPNQDQFVIGFDGKGLFREYDWVKDAPVAAFLDILRYAVYSADYRLAEYRANESAEVRELMYISWMELANKGNLLEIKCEHDAEKNEWVFGHEIKPEVPAKKSNVEAPLPQPPMTQTPVAPATKLLNTQSALSYSGKPDYIYIGRNAKTYPKNFGNPYSCIAGKGLPAPDNDTSCVYFEEWLYGKRDTDKHQEQRKWMIEQLKAGALRGKEVVCYNHGGHCHGEILRDIANGTKPVPVFNTEPAVTSVAPAAATKSKAASSVYVPLRPSQPVPHKDNHTPCQTRFFELLATGQSIFLTGKAGTGKTYSVIEAINNWSDQGDRVVVLGSTGISVMNMGGSLDEDTYAGLATVNSGFALGIGFDQERKNHETDWQWANHLIAQGEKNPYVKTLFTCPNGEALRVVIDEVSMVDARLLWVVWQILRKINPFAQILVVGDGGQLKAVGKKAVQFFKQAQFDGYKGDVVNIMDLFEVIRLETNCRQANDRAFAEALDHLWAHNEFTGVLLERLKACVHGAVPNGEYTDIRFNNVAVERINKQKTDLLTGEKRVYRGEVKLMGAKNDRWLKDFAPISNELLLAVGMPVKLRKNRWKVENNRKILEVANGSVGVITELRPNSVMVEWENGKTLEIVPVEFEGRRLPNGSRSGVFTQLPIHPNFASTGHSCQGLTITGDVVIGIYQERVVMGRDGKPVLNSDGTVKTTKYALTDSEWLYVACSRVTSAEHLYFDCSDPDTLGLFNASIGGKDREYIEWLESRLAQ